MNKPWNRGFGSNGFSRKALEPRVRIQRVLEESAGTAGSGPTGSRGKHWNRGSVSVPTRTRLLYWRARLRFKSSIDGTVRASISPLTRRPGPHQLFVLVVRPSAGAPLARRRLFLLLFLLPLCGAAATAMGARARAPAPRGARVGGSSRLTSARTSRAAVVLSSSSSWTVVVLVSRLLFGRRSVRSEGAARGGATGAARAPRTARVNRVGG